MPRTEAEENTTQPDGHLHRLLQKRRNCVSNMQLKRQYEMTTIG